jgi:hypothetical protein
LETVQETQNKIKSTPFEQERKAFLQSLADRKKKIENEITRESDKIDEYYAKKTRDSIYRNLVGGNQQWLSQ